VAIPLKVSAPIGKTQSIPVVSYAGDCSFDETNFLKLVNSLREEPLKLDNELEYYAQQRANGLTSGLDNHVGFRELTSAKVFSSNFIFLGENLASNLCPDDKILFEQLKASPGHRANMERARFDVIGIGFYKDVVVTLFGDQSTYSQ